VSGPRLRHVAEVNPSTPEFDALKDEDEVSFVPLERVWPNAFDPSESRQKGSVSTGYTRFRDGDVVVPKITPTFQADRTLIVHGLKGGVGAGTTELHIVRAGPGIETRYVRYLMSTRSFLHGGEAEMIGVAGQKRVPDSWLRDCQVPVTDVEQQRRIADFLDAETARIDALITAIQQMIDVLAVRTELDRVVLTSETGVPTGIPTIPTMGSDWSLLRNKNFLTEIVDLSETGTEEMLSVSHLTGVTPRSEKTVYMFEAESTVGYKRVQPGDLVINTMWAWMGAAGVSQHAGIVSPAYGVYRFDRRIVDPGWFDILVRSRPFVDEMTRYSRGVWSSRLRLYPDEFLRLRTPVPPMAAQRSAIERFHERRVQAFELTTTLTRQIELLRERRQALITAAVTGELAI